MSFWSFFLAPFGLIYGLITYLRNKLFDLNIFRSYEIPLKSIVVGNLSVGGTGKTPHVFYISKLLSRRYKTVVLSRGYGRKSKGYKNVYDESKAIEVGDEPLLLKKRLGDNVSVSVCEDRISGINILLENFNPQVIVLDDALQHRKIIAGLNIILTEFNRPFFDDFIMPIGRLRELRSGKKRADIFIVTKCPSQISDDEKLYYSHKIGVNPKKLFFSKIVYAPFQSFSITKVETIKSIFLVTAIADDSAIIQYLSQSFSVKTFKFRDHHTFTKEDITKIHLKFDVLPESSSVILTTEKDFVKLKEFKEVTEGNYPWYFLPIDIEIDRENEFNQLLISYVGTN